MSCCGPSGWGTVGMIVTIVGAILAATFNNIVAKIMNEQLTLKEGTATYKNWEKAPIPLYMKVYLFNVTNSQEVMAEQAQPIVQELGPYTFSEVHVRVNVDAYDNATLKFQQKKLWRFLPELSNGSLDDPVTTVNPVIASVTYMIRDKSPILKKALNLALLALGSSYFVEISADELLFSGFSDPLLDIANQFPPGIFPPYEKFGWFYNRNGSTEYDGVFNVFTGTDDVSKLLELDMWNGVKKTKYYQSHCGMINGSFGEGWPPYRTRTEISLYATDLCRSLTLDYVEDVAESGITFYRYAGTKRMFANATENPDNWCFCPDGQCQPSGVVDSSPCRYGIPAFVSFPHFYNADQFYLRQVGGMEPQRHLHEFHIDLEPRTATPLKVNARLQINLLIEPIDDIAITKKVPRTFLPVTWFSLTADLRDDPKLLSLVKVSLAAPMMGTVAFLCLCLAGVITVTVSAVIFVRAKKKQKANSIL